MFTVLDDLLQTLFPSYCRGCRKAIPTKTLVWLNARQRTAQIKDAFSIVDSSVFAGKHLLLVDDVVTTGTTLSEATNCLLQIEDVQVSVATIAFAKSPLP